MTKKLVSDDEVRAASGMLERLSKAAGRESPIPDTLMRFILEEAAMVRAGMKRAPVRALAQTNGDL